MDGYPLCPALKKADELTAAIAAAAAEGSDDSDTTSSFASSDEVDAPAPKPVIDEATAKRRADELALARKQAAEKKAMGKKAKSESSETSTETSEED